MEKKKEGLGFISMFLMLVGTMVGPSIVVYIGYALGYTGFSVWLALVIGLAIGIFMYLPMQMMSSKLMLRGGEYSVICALGSKKLAGMFCYAGVLSWIGMSSMIVACAGYVVSILTGMNTTLVGVILLVIFYLMNIFKIDFLSKVQNVITVMLIVCLGVFFVVGVGKINQPIFNFSHPEFFRDGMPVFYKFTNIFGFIVSRSDNKKSVHSLYILHN